MKIFNEQDELLKLRDMREKECFSVINRGKLWYNCLADWQVIELRDWYFAWLDVTETRHIPIKPEWLNNKLQREEQIW